MCIWLVINISIRCKKGELRSINLVKFQQRPWSCIILCSNNTIVVYTHPAQKNIKFELCIFTLFTLLIYKHL